jgi:hypothetical protein
MLLLQVSLTTSDEIFKACIKQGALTNKIYEHVAIAFHKSRNLLQHHLLSFKKPSQPPAHYHESKTISIHNMSA